MSKEYTYDIHKYTIGVDEKELVIKVSDFEKITSVIKEDLAEKD